LRTLGQPTFRLRPVTVEAFAAAATRFIQFVEHSETLDSEAFVRNVQPLVVDVYSGAMSLDGGEPADDAEPPASMSTEEWLTLFQRLQRQLAAFDAVVDGSLSDDIADIYRDLRDGLITYDAGATGEAVWKWRTEFESHWGQHAAHAIYALQVLRSEYVT
jgi:hypothetical protein